MISSWESALLRYTQIKEYKDTPRKFLNRQKRGYHHISGPQTLSNHVLNLMGCTWVISLWLTTSLRLTWRT